MPARVKQQENINSSQSLVGERLLAKELQYQYDRIDKQPHITRVKYIYTINFTNYIK